MQINNIDLKLNFGDGNFTLKTQSSYIKQILLNLLNNSKALSDRKNEKKITLNLSQDSKNFYISVSDKKAIRFGIFAFLQKSFY